VITRDLVVEKILGYLNGEVAEADLVRWAEDAFVHVTESDMDVPDEEAIVEALGYLAAADSPGFPLTWTVLCGFLARLGVHIRAVPEAA
jgi:hypothetical protein